MIYADTSALAKLVYDESESDALDAWLRERTDEPLATNVIGVVELRRFAARISPAVSAAAARMIQSISRINLTATACALAADVPPPTVRTLDALHITSAAEITELSAFLTYDHRMAEAAAGFGLPVVAPGR